MATLGEPMIKWNKLKNRKTKQKPNQKPMINANKCYKCKMNKLKI